MSTSTPRSARGRETALITGGAGFVATNVAERLLREGGRVRLFDNLSRPGVERNLRGLKGQYGERVEFVRGDVRDPGALSRAVRDVDRVFHFAAQVAVTTSLVDPVLDFDVNARGTLNLLEAVRALEAPPSVVFTSTNKVYGRLDDVPLRATGSRYEPTDGHLARCGVGESRPVAFHSPYGCSKGAAEQYVLDYARTFRLPATVFRMSCAYGPHQFGTEDQGWVAHFAIQSLNRGSLTLYGDGRQVRDVLYVDDLVEAMILAHDRIDVTAGEAYNIGGGPANSISLLELLGLLGDLVGRPPDVRVEPWRPADQRFYVSDVRRFRQATGWRPRVAVAEGLERLVVWLAERSGLVPRTLALGRVAS